MQQHLMVAGCSFSAPSQTLPGTSWSEVLANRFNWRLTNLARQGCSNGGIRIQIDEIIRQRPDFAIITPTFHDRMEVPGNAAPAPGVKEVGYDRRVGIDNVNYGNNPYRLICETIFSLAENLEHSYRFTRIDKLTQQAVQQYVNFIYDSEWKKQMDEWIICEGIYQLYHARINFLLVPVLLWKFDSTNANQWAELFNGAIPPHCIMSNSDESILPITGENPFVGEDPGYHGSPRSQEIIADNYYWRMRRYFNLHPSNC